MQQKNYKTVYQILRIAVAMCFIGHGAFGIITKPIWVNYFAVFGISEQLAYKLMPVVGSIDILMGISMLVYPTRAIALWLIMWGFITATLRPLSGEPFAELMERAGNYGVPLVLLLLTGFPKNFKEALTKIKLPASVSDKTLKRITICLRVIVFLLLAGHGWLNLLGKKALMAQYTSLGFGDPQHVASVIGYAEIAAAVVAATTSLHYFIFIFFIWKMASETLYPHYMVFEWVERGGSYAALLALWFMLFKQHASQISFKQNEKLQLSS